MRYFIIFVLFAAPCALLKAAELSPGIFSISGFNGMLPFDELQPLKAMIGKSDYVGIGEAVHAAGGYADGRFRISRFLIEDMGFRSVGIEAPFSAVFPINEFIRTCSGRPEEAGKGIYRAWKDQGFIDFMRWACEFNNSHAEDPVYFYGFDPQYQIGYSAAAFRGYLKKYSALDEPGIGAGIKNCFAVQYETISALKASDEFKKLISGAQIPKDDNRRCLAGVAHAALYLKQNKSRLVLRSSQSEYQWAMLHLLTVKQSQLQFFNHNLNKPEAYNARDKAMAELAVKIHDIENPNSKTVLWAHNAHLAMQWAKTKPAQYGVKMTGTLLAEKLGSRYFPIAQVGYSVTVNEGDLGGNPDVNYEQKKSTDERSLEFHLHKFGAVGILADAKSSYFEPGAYSSLWMIDEPRELVPHEQFGAYLFFEEVRPFIKWNN